MSVSEGDREKGKKIHAAKMQGQEKGKKSS